MPEERAFWVAWSRIAGIGPTLLLRLQRHFGTLSEAWYASATALEAVEGVGEQISAIAVKGRSPLDPDAVLQQHEQENPHFWTPADPDYPRLLLEIPDPPPVLYYSGVVEPLENQGIIPCVAIVGTREPTDYGRRWTRRITAALAQAGYTIVSGLAEGVDTETHHACLGAGGRTIAVLGTGVDMVYPWSNRNLSQQVQQQGLLLSEYPAGSQPDRTHFPRRNRIIAGLSRVVLVMEAPHKSGALITARLANDYCREVYALPGSLDNNRSKGCLELINTGAHMILGEKQLLAALESLPQLDTAQLPTNQLSLFEEEDEDELEMSRPQPRILEPLIGEPVLKQVFEAVPLEPLAIDLIVQQVGLDTATVLSSLAQLELMGLISQLPGMRYQRGG
ncbi:DNA-protecting protein DprA [Oscillatoria sp. FACHB-1407]|uniref:DNA-processing protein DprA n=1 Tax=Oscillatoria sp. FACHB-1407 TaxID=2692847 RepID=UPI001683CD55|nr:DNA-processing protein DprA [Oscillatoria sp. FACHB-1407]MBD2461775.1 DNA-protecting protein DprA [Oscillatoria sp. FACHB-1407]